MTKLDFVPWASAPPSWVTAAGNDLDNVVLSSRIRLARNFLGVPFPHNATAVQQKKSLENTLDALKSSAVLAKSTAIRLNQLSQLERQFLMERQLMSHELAQKQGEVGVIVSAGEILSVMINEEDHLRLACFQPGLALTESWELLSQLDDEIGSQLPLSFNSDLGYITACPTNMGTGLRASALLHLPGLVITGKIQNVVKGLASRGLTARGFYGEGTSALGDLFQFSNARTLGQSEAQIIKDVDEAVREIAELEQTQRQNINDSSWKLKVEDQIFRAYGTMRNAKMLNLIEGMKLVSLVRLGAKMGKDLSLKVSQMTPLFFLSQPAHLLIRSSKGKQQTTDEALRAEFFRSQLKAN